MSGGDIAAIVGGLSALLSAMYATRRKAQADEKKQGSDNTSVLLGGWRDFNEERLKELEHMRRTFQEQVEELRREHDADRKAWGKEKEAMQKEIDTLKTQVFILIEQKARGTE